jgi:ribonuclease HI
MQAPEKQPPMPRIEIYTDGGCDPNPGPGGYGVVLVHPRKRSEISGGFRLTTNNRMEIMAAIKALEMLKQPCQVTLHSDSRYLVDAMTKGWVAAWKRRNWWRTNQERAANADLWERLYGLCQVHRVDFRWIQAHAGDQENERCDALSRAGRRPPNLPADEGYEHKPGPDDERPRLTEAGQPCWKCSTSVLKKQAKKKATRDYYYEYYLWCPKCGATYEVEAAKRFIEQPPSLF